MNDKIIEKQEKYDKEIKRINDNIVYRLKEYKKMLQNLTKNSDKETAEKLIKMSF